MNGGTVALLGLLLMVAGPLRAQADPRLVGAVRSAQEGQGDSARAAVKRLLDATAPGDTLYPEILYTQAMVADNAADMRRSLQRVIVEYPTSSWTDDALVRLVQMDYATRSFDAAARNLERLRQDYPLTPLYAQASYWAARTYFDLKDQVLACQWLSEGLARVGDDLELQNQLGYLNQRCALASADSGAAGQSGGGADSTAGRADSTRRPDTTRAALPLAKPAADSLPRRPPAQRPRYRIQVAAVATPAAADDAADAAEKLGYSAVIVRERGLYKVRAGAFATREEAQAAVARVKAKLGGSPFVVAIP